MKVLFATTNPAKIKKYADKLKEKDIEILTIKDLGINLKPEETGKKSVSVFSHLPPSVQKQPCQKDHQKCHADQDRKHILPHPRTCRLLFPGFFLRILLFCDTMSSYQEPMAVDAIGCTGYQRYQIFFRNDPKK